MKFRLNALLVMLPLAIVLSSLQLMAQVGHGGVPRSFSLAMPAGTDEPVLVAPPVTDNLLREDVLSPVPYRFATNLPADLAIGTSGFWTTAPDGSMVWRLSVVSPGALALTLYFDKFRLPEDGKLFVYNPQRTEMIGAFTSLNNNRHSTFATSLIRGDRVTVEYNAPAGTPVPELHISEVAYAYRGVADYSGLKTGFGGSGNCEVNINCPEGDNWQKQKRSVARIQVKRGGSNLWCTGSLVNNTRNDGKPYLLTADHCGRYATELELSQWIFYFDYEGTGCPDPSQEPALKSLTGAALVSHGGNGGNTGSDFFLVLLDSDIPDSYNAYYNGWSRETLVPSPSGVGIHHPQGDIKKISTYTERLQPSNWAGGAFLSHWQVNWIGTASGHGTTEGGSSGSPLFDDQGLLVGTLTGGDSGCDSANLLLSDYYGQFAYHWESNGTDSASGLKFWLDPDNRNLMTLNGWALSVGEALPADWLTLYPNPVTDHLVLQTGDSYSRNLSVNISDLWGKVILDRVDIPMQGHEFTISMAGVARGLYLVRVSDGEHHAIRKIVVL